MPTVLIKLVLFASLLMVLSTVTTYVSAQTVLQHEDTTYIKVHFLYGSRPLARYKETESKWFGGILGGHVGIEGDSGQILNFRAKGKFHIFPSDKKKHSRFDEHNIAEFYAYFGSNPDSVKRTIVVIPVTRSQKLKFDSIGTTYLQQTPYDYALWGMRCGAAAYEILGQLGITKSYPYSKTYKKIFYPQKLRRRLLAVAKKNHWTVERYQGSIKRKWEKD